MFSISDQKKRLELIFKVTMVVMVLVGMVSTITYIFVHRLSMDEFEIVDPLGGNLFPSAILSVATTDAQLIESMDGNCLGNPKSIIGIKVHSPHVQSVVTIELAETPFYSRSVSTFVLPEKGKDYIIYPDILWDYEALRANEQAEPISVAAQVSVDGENCGQRVRTFSVRSINECLLGYNKQFADGTSRFVSTRLLYAAYVNEESPLIDKVLRDALNTRIVRRFQGYQAKGAQGIDKQVYALWYALQKMDFRYSSVSYSSLSSNVVYSQRVRTFEDALNSRQINCVDGSVLFASLLRAINITPILVQIPGHMFVGYYTDDRHQNLTFLETTMIGDVNLDEYFPEEQLDSTTTGLSQEEMSRITFEKSQEYATKKYKMVENQIRNNHPRYLMVEISKGVRRKIQSIGK